LARSPRSNAATPDVSSGSSLCSSSRRFVLARSIRSEASSFVTSIRKMRDQRSMACW
jgi:hypothetical protein